MDVLVSAILSEISLDVPSILSRVRYGNFSQSPAMIAAMASGRIARGAKDLPMACARWRRTASNKGARGETKCPLVE